MSWALSWVGTPGTMVRSRLRPLAWPQPPGAVHDPALRPNSVGSKVPARAADRWHHLEWDAPRRPAGARIELIGRINGVVAGASVPLPGRGPGERAAPGNRRSEGAARNLGLSTLATAPGMAQHGNHAEVDRAQEDQRGARHG